MTSMSGRHQIVELSDQLIPVLVPPPQERPGICSRCRTWNDAAPDDECSNCADVRQALGIEALPISLVTLYRKPSVLRDWLTQYKGRPDDQNPLVPEFGDNVVALLGRFFLDHEGALYDRLGGYDAIVVVPSTTRPPPHPLEEVVSRAVPSLRVVNLLARGPGDLGFRKPAKDGYIVTENPRPYGRILLIDDVYTTGSRLNSASFALRAADSEVAGAFVIARRVNTDFDPRAQNLWDRQSSEPFQWRVSPIIAAGG